MRSTLAIISFFFTHCLFANAIDSLKTDNDVLLFLNRIEKRFTSNNYQLIQILPTNTFRQKLNCDSIAIKWDINNWEKADFNGDHKTDLIVNVFWSDFEVFVAIDMGNNTYQLLQLSNDHFGNCELGKPIKFNSEQLLLFYRKRQEYDSPSALIKDIKLKSRIDTLIYKFGGFVEKNNSTASYEIATIEYYRSSGWTGITPVYEVIIPEEGTPTFEANTNNPKMKIAKENADTKIVKSILDLIQYINIKKLEQKYRVTWFDDTTLYLKITFRDGTIKQIEDYGMIGTYGLSHLYQLLFMLEKTKTATHSSTTFKTSSVSESPSIAIV